MRSGIGPTEASRLRAITGELASLTDDAPSALHWLVPAVRELLGSEKAFAWSVKPNGERAAVEDGATDRLPARLISFCDEWMATKPVNWTSYNPLRPEASQRNRAMTLGDICAATGLHPTSAPIGIEVYPRFGMARDDQLRVLVCDGASMLAWVGVSQCDPVTPLQKQLLQRLVGPMKRRLATERLLREGRTTRGLLDAAFEAIAAPAFVLGERGRLLDANRAGTVWLRWDRAAREALLASAVRGGRARAGFAITKIVARGAPVRFLAVRQGVDAAAAHALHASVSRWGFTRREAEIFAHLSRGKPNRAIAAELAISERTVETHLTSMFGKAQVGSRAELLARAMHRQG
jgi:DNA-binding CsgD family transcriptional regulator